MISAHPQAPLIPRLGVNVFDIDIEIASTVSRALNTLVRTQFCLESLKKHNTMSSVFVCMVFVMSYESSSQIVDHDNAATARDDASFRIVTSLAVAELLHQPNNTSRVNVPNNTSRVNVPNNASRVNVVDNTASSNRKRLGLWNSNFAPGVTYQATQDGIVQAFTTTSGYNSGAGYTDDHNPPTTQRAAFGLNAGGQATFSMPVRAGDFWKAVGGSLRIYWIPLDSPALDSDSADSLGDNEQPAGLGGWNVSTVGKVYQASTDGFVQAFTPGSGYNSGSGVTDSHNPPTTTRAAFGLPKQGSATFTMPVIKGDYWMVGGSGMMVYWIALSPSPPPSNTVAKAPLQIRPSCTPDEIDACGVCRGDSRACCTFAGTSNGTACDCDGTNQAGESCGHHCQLVIDGCDVCGGNGRSCCSDNNVMDPVNKTCGPRQVTLVVAHTPGNPDGFPMPVIAVRSPDAPSESPAFPGPSINVVVGERLQVTVVNEMHEQVTSVHFHGLHQKNNAWMDGAYTITGCGIRPGAKFTYDFNITQTGTFWYHSHVHAQYTEGMQGPLVATPADIANDTVYQTFPYTVDFTVMMMEWFHQSGPELALEYEGPWSAFPGYKPQYPWPPVSVLFNGKGRFNCSRIEACEKLGYHGLPVHEKDAPCQTLRGPAFNGNCTEEENHLSIHADHRYCQRDGWVRIRLINSAANIPMRFWIDRHNLTIVARDGEDIVPFVVKAVTVPVSQRLDVMVRCNITVLGVRDPTFVMFTSANPNWFPFDSRPTGANGYGPFYNQLYSFGYLRYTSVDEEYNYTALYDSLVTPEIDPELPTTNLNNATLFEDSDMLREYSYKPLEPTAGEAPPAIRQVVIRATTGWDSVSGSALEWWFQNNKSFVAPPLPLLHQKLIEGYATRHIGHHPPPPPSATSYGIGEFDTNVIDVELGEVIEVVIISDSGQQHPWHLHGYSAYLLGAETIVNPDAPPANTSEVIAAFKYDGKFGALNDTASGSLGDSWTAPAYGYMVFRIVADNPGPWFLHCHIDWHLSLGMALVVDVGWNKSYTGTESPPDDLPLCGPVCTAATVNHNKQNAQQIKQLQKQVTLWQIGVGVLCLFLFITVIAIIVLCCQLQGQTSPSPATTKARPTGSRMEEEMSDGTTHSASLAVYE